jgi:UDP-N-acetylmuramate-alanine ligase
MKLAKGIREFGHKNVDHIENIELLVPQLKLSLQPGDVVITLGAGNIGELARKFAAEFRD